MRDGLTRRALIVVGVVAALLTISGVMVYIVDTLLILFGSILFALALRKLGGVIASRTGLSPFHGFLCGTMLLVAVTAGGLTLVGPSMYQEIQQAGPRFAEVVEDFTDQLQRQEWMSDVKTRLQESEVPPEAVLSSGLVPQVAQTFFGSSFGLIASLALIFIIGFWIAWHPELYLEMTLKLAPPSLREHFRSILRETGETLTNWVLGRLLAMLTVGVLSSIALLLLGVPMPFTLGIIAGLISFVPTIGAFIAIIPAVLFAVPQGFEQVVAVIGCYTVIQLLENNVITPLVMQQAVSIPPAFVLLMQLAMGMLIGGLGVAFAVPLAAGASVLIRRLYIEDVLGDENADELSNDDASNNDRPSSQQDDSQVSADASAHELQTTS